MTEADTLRIAVGRLRSVVEEQEACEVRLEDLKAQRKRLEETDLPEIFAAMGIRKFEMEDGSILASGVVVRGTLPKDHRKEAAIQWMIDNGLENVLETTLEASWPRGQRSAALAALERVDVPGARVDDSVHWRTYCRVINDKIKEGAQVPLDVLGVALIPGVRFTNRRARPAQETAL